MSDTVVIISLYERIRDLEKELAYAKEENIRLQKLNESLTNRIAVQSESLTHLALRREAANEPSVPQPEQ